MNLETIRARLAKYFASSPYPIQSAYVFGSRARGQALAFSDIDIGVLLDEPDHAARLAMYKPLLGDLMNSLQTTEVDLAYVNDASPALAYNIIGGTRLYVKDEDARARSEADIWTRFFDARENEQEYFRLLNQRILAGNMDRRTPEMIDRVTVQRRLDYIQIALQELQTYRAASFDEFKKDRRTVNAAAYQLQTAIEAVTDIANHLVAALGLGQPKERADAITMLAREEVLPDDLARNLKTAIGMRNKLVHGYIDLMIESLHQTLRDDLGDLSRFAQCIIRFLDSQGVQP
jgi:uncharacterized protein YutE (UPF0331/DUF86 family)/predicted nucleotidyltransferase